MFLSEFMRKLEHIQDHTKDDLPVLIIDTENEYQGKIKSVKMSKFGLTCEIIVEEDEVDEP